MTADQAKAAADMLATVWEGEFPATCAALAAVKDGQLAAYLRATGSKVPNIYGPSADAEG